MDAYKNALKKFRWKRRLNSIVSTLFPDVAERECSRYLKRVAYGWDAKNAREAAADAVNRVKYTAINQWKKQIKKTLGVDCDPSIDLKDYERELADLFNSSMKAMKDRTGEFEPNVRRKKINSSVKRISRDLVSDVMWECSSRLYKKYGVTHYVWKARNDGRTRICHAELSGQVTPVNKPPEMWHMSGGKRVFDGRRCHPGQDYGCRCVAIPIFTRKTVEAIRSENEEE